MLQGHIHACVHTGVVAKVMATGGDVGLRLNYLEINILM